MSTAGLELFVKELLHQLCYTQDVHVLTSSLTSHSTYKTIEKGSEILVYYGNAYAKELNIDVRAYKAKPAKAPLAQAAGSGNCSHYTLGLESFISIGR